MLEARGPLCGAADRARSDRHTNTVIVITEYLNLVSMAQSTTKVVQSAEWQQFIAEFAAAGMCVTSNSVSVEVTP